MQTDEKKQEIVDMFNHNGCDYPNFVVDYIASAFTEADDRGVEKLQAMALAAISINPSIKSNIMHICPAIEIDSNALRYDKTKHMAQLAKLIPVGGTVYVLNADGQRYNPKVKYYVAISDKLLEVTFNILNVFPWTRNRKSATVMTSYPGQLIEVNLSNALFGENGLINADYNTLYY